MNTKPLIVAALLSTLTVGDSYAATTVINFDGPDIPLGSVGSHYADLGVLAAGAEVVPANISPWPPHSGENIVYAPDGAMNFYFELENVKTVSAYVSGVMHTGLFAYDSEGNLLADTYLPSALSDVLLTVTSNTTPITRVEIHDGGASFGVDDLTIVHEDCTSVTSSLHNLVEASPNSLYRNTKTAAKERAALLLLITKFEDARSAGAAEKTLLTQLKKINSSANLVLKDSAEKNQITDLIREITEMTQAGQC